ncbi:MAG: cytochrome P450 [Acidimicrobiales bacterium]|nr:cytochrome P450 [Acidimicrobiales bacterium]MCB1013577.1 cytochrome P450 [Acidimicrobiales bacterium]
MSVEEGTVPVREMAPDEALAALFFSDAGLDDPNPYYHRLRAHAPVHHSATGAIFLTRYEDCREVLRDNRFGKATREGDSLIPSSDPAVAEYRRDLLRRRGPDRPMSMLFLNPPAHTRQRGLVSRAFTPRRVEELRSRIRALADGVVDRFVEQGGGDLLEAVGFPLPVAVIGAMVGVPEADWPRFRSLITAAAAGIEAGATVEELKAAEAANAEVYRYFEGLVAERRARPRDDLLTDLLAVDDAGDRLSEPEVIVVAMLLFAAGFETTTNLIGNGMAALLRNPAEMVRLWDDPARLPGAVEEMLRWDSPVQLDVRTALEPAEVAGEPVPEGQSVVTLLGAANRDPDHFADPDRFDVGRDEGPPMSFASGIHYCLGANLSRAEGHEVFGSLIERCRSIELDGPLVRRHRMTLRGFEAVPVRVVPR